MLGKRIVFEFLVQVDTHAAQWQAVLDLLHKFKAEHITQPTGSPPYIVTAIVSEDTDMDKVLKQLRNLANVGRVEEDAPREGF